MSGFPQLLLVSVILTLTLLLLFVGFQVFSLLHDFRLSLKKLNHILDQSDSQLPAATVKQLGTVRDFLNHFKPLIPESKPTRSNRHQSSVVRRFFRKSGLPLRAS